MEENTPEGRWGVRQEIAGAVKQRWGGGGVTEGADNSAGLRSLALSGEQGGRGRREGGNVR